MPYAGNGAAVTLSPTTTTNTTANINSAQFCGASVEAAAAVTLDHEQPRLMAKIHHNEGSGGGRSILTASCPLTTNTIDQSETVPRAYSLSLHADSGTMSMDEGIARSLHNEQTQLEQTLHDTSCGSWREHAHRIRRFTCNQLARCQGLEEKRLFSHIDSDLVDVLLTQHTFQRTSSCESAAAETSTLTTVPSATSSVTPITRPSRQMTDAEKSNRSFSATAAGAGQGEEQPGGDRSGSGSSTTSFGLLHDGTAVVGFSDGVGVDVLAVVPHSHVHRHLKSEDSSSSSWTKTASPSSTASSSLGTSPSRSSYPADDDKGLLTTLKKLASKTNPSRSHKTPTNLSVNHEVLGFYVQSKQPEHRLSKVEDEKGARMFDTVIEQEATADFPLRSLLKRSPPVRLLMDPREKKHKMYEPNHLILLWTHPGANYVEVSGTMANPVWETTLPLWWCPRTHVFWIDLHETVPNLCGIIQFKFIVDGVWKCDPTYPICDDGSSEHNLNNVCVVFPQRLRMRLSNQKLRRRCGDTHDGGVAAGRSQGAPGPTTGDGASKLIQDDERNTDNRREDTPHLYRLSPSAGEDDDDESPAAARSATGRSADDRRGRRNSSEGLMRCPHWATPTSPPSRSRWKLRRWSKMMESALSPSPPVSSRPATPGAQFLLPQPRGGGASSLLPEQDGSRAAPRERALSMIRPSSPRQWEGCKKADLQLPIAAPVISGRGSSNSRISRHRLIEKAARQSTGVATRQSPGQGGQGEAADEARRRRRTEKLKTNLEGLARCLSHHGGRASGTRSATLSAESEMESSLYYSSALYGRTCWPASVTERLHDPDVILELCLPTNVLKKTGEDVRVLPGWAMSPHPEKYESGGADSFYISPDGCCMAIADGVGHEFWSFSPRMYADELVLGIRSIWEDPDHPIHWIRRSRKLSPSYIAKELMRLAAKKPGTYGSATCCIAVFDSRSQSLGICNLGDSGLCVLRRNRKGKMMCRMKTPEMVHFFNCPYQLSKSPPTPILLKLFGLMSRSASGGKGLGVPTRDGAHLAQRFDVSVEEGDLIVMASDGLWDNLWPSEVTSVCNLTLAPFEALILHDEELQTDPQDIAHALVEAAVHRSRDRRSRTPFAKSYTSECGMPAMTGGKWDDITILTAWLARRTWRDNDQQGGTSHDPSSSSCPTPSPQQQSTSYMAGMGCDTSSYILNSDQWTWPYRAASFGDLLGSTIESEFEQQLWENSTNGRLKQVAVSARSRSNNRRMSCRPDAAVFCEDDSVLFRKMPYSQQHS